MTADPAVPHVDDDAVVLRRWQRFGHDRTYVRTGSGAQLGYRDNRTGIIVPVDATDRAALCTHLDAAPVTDPPPVAPTPVIEPDLPAATVIHQTAENTETAAADVTDPAEARVDLAATAPGSAARARAVELRRAAPVRTFVARVLGRRTEERAWRIGADGEESVAAELRRLGDRWRILHAVPIGEKGADIDHVVIGPAGVFTVNSKHHPHAKVWVGGNTVMVNGTRVPYVRNSRFEATRSSRLLSGAAGRVVPVIGIIAVVRCADLVVKAAPTEGVVVTTRRQVATWLQRQPDVLTDDQVQALYELARRPPTWR